MHNIFFPESDDIAMMISPTREKLMPTIPKGSPQKTAKTMSPRSSPKKRVKGESVVLFWICVNINSNFVSLLD